MFETEDYKESKIVSASGDSQVFLTGRNLSGGYNDGPNIINDCNISVNKNEIAVIVGPNGAGKSTLMKALLGLLNLRRGKVLLEGEDVTSLSPQERIVKGFAFVPQNNNVFTSMTVEENFEMGGFTCNEDYVDIMEQIYLLFPVLRDKRQQIAGQLSGGQRQQVAFGRALMSKPKVLLLDEPTAGVSPVVMDELFSRIVEISRTGIPVIMVEQNARQALSIANKGFILIQGRNAFSGPGAELLANQEARKSFLLG